MLDVLVSQNIETLVLGDKGLFGLSKTRGWESKISQIHLPQKAKTGIFFFLMQLGSTGGGVPGNLERNLNFFSHRQCFSISDPWASEAGHSYRKNILFFFRQNKRIKFSLWPWSSSSCLAKEQYINNTKLYCKNNWLEKPRF